MEKTGGTGDQQVSPDANYKSNGVAEPNSRDDAR